VCTARSRSRAQGHSDPRGPARATIDAAAWARTPRERTFIITSAAQQRLVTTARLRRAEHQRTDCVVHRDPRDPRQWEADLIRQNELTVATGALVLHVTAWQIRHDPDEFLELLRRLGVR
jgi:hypothetical protein